ncbi:MAG: hypothetical protein AVDCRST_MAG17-1427, partial [uncultured Solirubrobacterales bacterium]
GRGRPGHRRLSCRQPRRRRLRGHDRPGCRRGPAGDRGPRARPGPARPRPARRLGPHGARPCPRRRRPRLARRPGPAGDRVEREGLGGRPRARLRPWSRRLRGQALRLPGAPACLGRVRAVLRRAGGRPARGAIRVGELSVDPETREVRFGGAPV